MAKLLAGLTAFAVVVPLAWGDVAAAADQGAFARVSHARSYPQADRNCGCCGCWYPEYVSHRELLYAYPSDPRYTLTSEPYYFPGRMRSYIHNW